VQAGSQGDNQEKEQKRKEEMHKKLKFNAQLESTAAKPIATATLLSRLTVRIYA
jgi:hypothetical protein